LNDSADRQILAAAVSRAVAARRHEGGDEVLAELGWADMLTADTSAALAVAFNELGADCIASSYLSDVVARGLGLPPGSGGGISSYGSSAPPGTIIGSAESETLTVSSTTGDTVIVRRADLEVTPFVGIYPNLGLASVCVDAEARVGAAGRLWSETTDLGRVALAHEVATASRSILMLATTLARDRVQFGRAIGSFQPVRHMLAEALIAVEAAEAGVDAAHHRPSRTTALLAQVLAGRALGRREALSAGAGWHRVHS